MTVKEFLNKTENMIISDYDLNEETGFVEVNFGVDIYGGVNYVHICVHQYHHLRRQH